MARFLKDRHKTKGAAPGSLIFIGQQKVAQRTVQVIRYSPDGVKESAPSTVDKIRAAVSGEHITWINVYGVHDTDFIAQLGNAFNISPLILEDIVNTDQRPRFSEETDHLYIIATDNTASASEMVISGLRGLDVPVTIIGTRTEGKNCGMDVMVRTIDRYEYEFAPITFLNYNAKDFNDYADGFEADVDMTTYFADDADKNHVQNATMFPMPLAPWGMATYDLALHEAMTRVTGGTLKTETADAAPTLTRSLVPGRATIARPERPGMTLTEQERMQIREAQVR